MTIVRLFILNLSVFLLSWASLESARIKDLTDVRGSRSNQIRGYGIVTGLNGQGDSRIEYTELGILNALENFGIRADKADKSRNIAAVMVTADIGPFAKEGTRMDVTVSSIGNADSLQGGILLQTPLFGPDNKIAYAVAQGPVYLLGACQRGNAGGANIQVNHPTVGIVSNGGIVEVEIASTILQVPRLICSWLAPDSTTAVKMAAAINNIFPATSLATDSGLVNVQVPVQYRGQITNFLSAIGNIDVKPDISLASL